MAWIEQDRGGNFHLCFRFGGRKFKRSLDTTNARRAEARRVRLEENVQLVKAGRLEIPDDSDPACFLLSDGKLNGKPTVLQRLTLGRLFRKYWASLPRDSHEPETIRVAEIHSRHLKRILGQSRAIGALHLASIQEYINRRAGEKVSNGRTISPTTIKKEIATLRTVWNWALSNRFISVSFPKKLHYPKTDERPPFQTWSEIEHQIAVGSLPNDEQRALWDCLYLSLDELQSLLTDIKERARYFYLYPMAVMAVYTGARRSELCRSHTADFDWRNSVVTIRETKRARGRRTTRQIPISEPLRAVIRQWLKAKRESTYTFPAEHYVRRTRRMRPEDAVSPDEASDQLARTLEDTRWCVIRGWHMFRHSFCSNCASAGIDQRMIDTWMGHQTDEMRKRYRHLFPDVQHAVLDELFTKRFTT